MQLHRMLPSLVLLLGGALACSDSGSPVGPVDPAGAYAATRFTTTVDGATTDQLAAGVELSMVLAADGTVTGTLAVPIPDAVTVPLALAGTWTRQGSEVRFDLFPDTFLDLLPFQVTGGALATEGVVGPTTFRVTLSR